MLSKSIGAKREKVFWRKNILSILFLWSIFKATKLVKQWLKQWNGYKLSRLSWSVCSVVQPSHRGRISINSAQRHKWSPIRRSTILEFLDDSACSCSEVQLFFCYLSHHKLLNLVKTEKHESLASFVNRVLSRFNSIKRARWELALTQHKVVNN